MNPWIPILRACPLNLIVTLKNTSKFYRELIENNYLEIMYEFISNTKFNNKFRLMYYQCLLASYKKSMLWDVEMGLGKTITALLRFGLSGNNLVVCPSFIIEVWVKEITNYFPTMSYHVCNTKDKLADTDLHIISYNKLSKSSYILDNHWNIIVFDECHKVSNTTTAIFRSSIKLKSEHKIAMSGTIIRNNPKEFRNVLKVTGIPTSNYMKHYKELKIKDTEVKLPQLNETIHFIDLDHEHRQLYDKVHRKFSKAHEEFVKKIAKINNVITVFLRLRQICLSPRLFLDDSELPQLTFSLSPKLQKIKDIIKTCKGKIVIMSKFSSMLIKLNEVIPGILLIGKTKNKKSSVQNFSEGSTKILYAQSDMASEGINLTCANNIILLEPWWNGEVDKQSIARIWRIGQNKMCNIYRLIVRNTVEEVMLKLCSDKKNIIKSIKMGTYKMFL